MTELRARELVALREEIYALQTTSEALEFWCRNHEVLHDADARLIVSVNDGAFKQESTVSLGATGRLFSAFSGEKLAFFDEKIAGQMLGTGTAHLGVDYDILFDTNAASLLRRISEGRKGDLQCELNEFLKRLGGRISWNTWLYLNENRAAVRRGERLDDVFATVLAGERFFCIDRDHFALTGEWRCLESMERCTRTAQEILGEWCRTFASLPEKTIFDVYDEMFSSGVLQMALIQLEAPSPRQAHKKFVRFLDFLHEKLHCISVQLAWCAWHLFSGSEEGSRFFRGFQKGRPGIVSDCENMAMDLCHWHWFQTISCTKGRDQSFMVPYFLTFDRGMSQLLAGLQWKAVLVLNGDHPITIHNFDLSLFYKNACGGENPRMKDYFTEEGYQRRTSEMDENILQYAELRDEIAERVRETSCS